MAKKEIVWTKYLSERTLLRAWYILENNFFKSAIKKAQVSDTSTGHASFAKCHNALYTGLYFPQQEYYEFYKPIPEIKKAKNLVKGGVMANTMPPYEILKNIHAMNIAGDLILTNSKINSLVNDTLPYSEHLYKTSYEAGKKISNIDVLNKLVNSDPESLKPVQTNCYRFVKKIKADLKLGKTIGTVYSESKKFKEERFQQSVSKYNSAYAQFVLALANYGILGQEKIKLMLSYLDNGLYQTMVGHLGFSFNELMKKENLDQLVTRKEIDLHTEKLNKATSALHKFKNRYNLTNLQTLMKRVGDNLRTSYIEKNKVYPECNKGFYNAFAMMLSMNFEKLNPQEIKTKNYPLLFDKLIQKINVLKQDFNATKSTETKQDIQTKLDEIEKILD